MWLASYMYMQLVLQAKNTTDTLDSDLYIQLTPTNGYMHMLPWFMVNLGDYNSYQNLDCTTKNYVVGSIEWHKKWWQRAGGQLPKKILGVCFYHDNCKKLFG